MTKTHPVSGVGLVIKLSLSDRDLSECSLSSSQSSDRNTERRAGYIIQTDLVAELNRCRVAAVLTADTAVELWINWLTKFKSHFHKLAYAVLVELSKWIVLVDLCIIVSIEELTSVIS